MAATTARRVHGATPADAQVVPPPGAGSPVPSARGPDARPGLARANLGERVYLLLWERILDRRLSAGEKLSDVRLAEELGVSRTPVREALQRLAQDGILRLEPNRGFRVASFSSRDVAEIYDLRAALEVMALEVAAPRLSPELLGRALAELDEVDRLRGRATTDEAWAQAAMAFLATDRWFHHQIVELAGNRRLEAIVKGLWAQIAVFQQAGSYRRDWFEAGVVHHRLVIAALLAGDPALAAEELRRHILEIKVFVRSFSVDLDPDPEEGEPVPPAPAPDRATDLSSMEDSP